MAKTTQLFCSIRSGEDKNTVRNIKSQVESALSGVDKRLTVYSQLQRRNVKRETFREDLSKLLESSIVMQKLDVPLGGPTATLY